MAQYSNPENNTEQASPEEGQTQDTTELTNIGENIDQKGGRVVNTPDFVELALQGFTDDQLKSILKLRRRYNETDENEITLEFKRMRFARYLYQQGRIS